MQVPLGYFNMQVVKREARVDASKKAVSNFDRKPQEDQIAAEGWFCARRFIVAHPRLASWP